MQAQRLDQLTKKILTVPQRKLLLAMYAAGPSILHRIGTTGIGWRQPVLAALVRAGYAEFSKSNRNDRDWWGRLTAVGRREAKALEHFR